jgi:hypothetical protein
MFYIKSNDPAVSSFLVFGPSGKDIRVQSGTSVHYSDSWSGGSRDQTVFVELSTGNMLTAADLPNRVGPFQLVEGIAELPKGYACVQRQMLQGHDLGYKITLHPDNIVALLPQGTSDDLSDAERKILKITKSYKSSYRREEARREGMRYDDYIPALKAKGYIAANGSITTKGKNVS